MHKLAIMMVAAVLVSGCGSMGTTARDMSTGEETALIEGLNKFSTDCTIHGPFPLVSDRDMHDISFFKRHSLIVDAGPVEIMVSCTAEDPFGSSFTEKARFDFIAEGGHTYTIAWKQDCMELLDATADGSAVACEPFYSGSYEDLSTTGETAIIRAGGASSDKGDCRPSTGGRRGRRGFLEVDAGPVTIDGECQARILPDFFGRRRRMSSFEFVAEAGHTYTITATEKECMSLLDITSEETVIACEPYEKSK